MFVRQKKNKSGVVRVQIIDKSYGHYKLYKTIGSSNDVVVGVVLNISKLPYPSTPVLCG